jgi:enoyl-CoA hydratase/carnithine racemase
LGLFRAAALRKDCHGSSGGDAPWRCSWVYNDLSTELAERYGYINRALPADQLTPFLEKLAHRIASFPAHAIAHAKAAVDTGAFSSLAQGLLVEAHESDLSVASEVTQARVTEALKLGAETYEGELEIDYLSRLSR